MILSEICVKRPVFAWVLTLIIVLLGIVTMERLPIRQYPKMEKNYVTIKMDLPGAGPEIVENLITRNIEEAVSGIEGIATIESTSDNETSKVSIEISEGKNIDSATNDIRDRLSKWADKFPQEAHDPILTKAGASEKSIMNLSLISSTMNDGDLYNYAFNEISHALESVPGVARIDVFGSGQYKMAVSLDPRKMAFYGLTVLDVSSAIHRQNVEKPAGKIVSGDREYVVTTVADVQTPEEFENIPVVTKKNNVIRIKDIGTVSLDTESTKVMSRFNGEQVVSISVISQSSANPIQVARGIKKKYEEVIKQLPSGVEFFVDYDSTTFIENSLDEVYETMFEAILLVVLVVFVFLRSFRAALIPLITVPISLIGALFIMYISGFSINNMTLMSMVLAIGLVVDDAIVVLENIYKHIEKGEGAIKAAIHGTKEVSFAVIAMTLTLCAVYAPVALAQGLTGKYLKEFSVTLAGAVLLSGFVALTLSPMMCSRTLTDKKENKSKESKNQADLSKIAVIWNTLKTKLDTSDLLKSIDDKYEVMLGKVLEKRRSVAFGALLFSGLGYLVYFFLPSEQIPYQDMGIIQYEGHAPHTSTLEFTRRYVDAIDKIIGQNDHVKSRDYRITNPTFEGIIMLKDKREKSTDDVMQEIQNKANEVAGVDIRFTSGHGGGGDDSRVVSFVVRGNKSHRELREVSTNLIREIYSSGIVQGVRSTSKNEAEDYTIEILRDKASVLNIDPSSISDTIDSLIRGRVASRFKKDNKMYDVMVEIQDDFKKNTDQLGDIYVKTHNEREEFLIPLSELIKVHARSGPVSIQRYNRTRSYTVVGILNPSTSLGESVNVVRDLAKNTLPEDVFIDFVGETKRYLTESNIMLMIFLLALSFIYLVMAAQFESWKDPFIIMLSVPLTLVGGVLTLACLKSGTVNIFSNIGFLTLVGLITKHGILIVDFANKLVEKGMDHKSAVKKASSLRLRPILMTTFAMVFGSLPLALASGDGCEIRIPLGAVIVGGMSIGTLFTIFVVPVFYTYIAPLGKRRRIIDID